MTSIKPTVDSEVKSPIGPSTPEFKEQNIKRLCYSLYRKSCNNLLGYLGLLPQDFFMSNPDSSSNTRITITGVEIKDKETFIAEHFPKSAALTGTSVADSILRAYSTMGADKQDMKQLVENNHNQLLEADILATINFKNQDYQIKLKRYMPDYDIHLTSPVEGKPLYSCTLIQDKSLPDELQQFLEQVAIDQYCDLKPTVVINTVQVGKETAQVIAAKLRVSTSEASSVEEQKRQALTRDQMDTNRGRIRSELIRDMSYANVTSSDLTQGILIGKPVDISIDGSVIGSLVVKNILKGDVLCDEDALAVCRSARHSDEEYFRNLSLRRLTLDVTPAISSNDATAFTVSSKVICTLNIKDPYDHSFDVMFPVVAYGGKENHFSLISLCCSHISEEEELLKLLCKKTSHFQTQRTELNIPQVRLPIEQEPISSLPTPDKVITPGTVFKLTRKDNNVGSLIIKNVQTDSEGTKAVCDLSFVEGPNHPAAQLEVNLTVVPNACLPYQKRNDFILEPGKDLIPEQITLFQIFNKGSLFIEK